MSNLPLVLLTSLVAGATIANAAFATDMPRTFLAIGQESAKAVQILTAVPLGRTYAVATLSPGNQAGLAVKVDAFPMEVNGNLTWLSQITAICHGTTVYEGFYNPRHPSSLRLPIRFGCGSKKYAMY